MLRKPRVGNRGSKIEGRKSRIGNRGSSEIEGRRKSRVIHGFVPVASNATLGYFAGRVGHLLFIKVTTS